MALHIERNSLISKVFLERRREFDQMPSTAGRVLNVSPSVNFRYRWKNTSSTVDA
jgi:hypothetical protein